MILPILAAIAVASDDSPALPDGASGLIGILRIHASSGNTTQRDSLQQWMGEHPANVESRAGAELRRRDPHHQFPCFSCSRRFSYSDLLMGCTNNPSPLEGEGFANDLILSKVCFGEREGRVLPFLLTLIVSLRILL